MIRLLLCLMVLLFFSVSLIRCAAFNSHSYKDFKLVSDGSFLFYNNPASVVYEDGFFVAYLTSEGGVKLDFWDKTNLSKSLLVHDYKIDINYELGFADDHAAPAIIYDEVERRLLIATAYHGTPMHVYEYFPETDTMHRLTVWEGRYTYPQFIKSNEGIWLLARNQKTQDSGDLVYRSASDDFQSERTVMQSGAGFVVYAGTPKVKDGVLYFTYSIHDYKKNALRGLSLAGYDLDSREVVSICDFSWMLDKDYISNRPTGLGIKKDIATFATSFFSYPVTYSSAEQENFSGEQAVKIIKGRLGECDSFKVVFSKNDVAMPYYDVDVAINDDGDWLFFDKDNVVTNSGIKNCFMNSNMLYPKFVEGVGVLYAVMNQPYAIRDFNNSLFGCVLQ
ncbi:hypothetical protein EGJ00_04300 [Pseudomonas saudiphocaensis]|nr:hypothetical protein EGJ00_04300 [Pseudomonas saudiphocaensis]